MCIIIDKPADFSLTTEWINEFWRRNSDGFGATYISKGRVKVFRTMHKEETIKFLKGLHPVAAILHFRFATHGTKTKDMCHPFQIMPGFFLTHNGVIQAPAVHADKSDTWSFVNNVVKPLVEGAVNPHELVRSDAFRYLVESHCGNGNRIVISDDLGHTIFCNKLWNKKVGGALDGIMLSNTYAWTDIDRPAYKAPSGKFGSNVYDSDDYWPESNYKRRGVYGSNVPAISDKEKAAVKAVGAAVKETGSTKPEYERPGYIWEEGHRAVNGTWVPAGWITNPIPYTAKGSTIVAPDLTPTQTHVRTIGPKPHVSSCWIGGHYSLDRVTKQSVYVAGYWSTAKDCMVAPPKLPSVSAGASSNASSGAQAANTLRPVDAVAKPHQRVESGKPFVPTYPSGAAVPRLGEQPEEKPKAGLVGLPKPEPLPAPVTKPDAALWSGQDSNWYRHSSGTWHYVDDWNNADGISTQVLVELLNSPPHTSLEVLETILLEAGDDATPEQLRAKMLEVFGFAATDEMIGKAATALPLLTLEEERELNDVAPDIDMDADAQHQFEVFSALKDTGGNPKATMDFIVAMDGLPFWKLRKNFKEAPQLCLDALFVLINRAF